MIEYNKILFKKINDEKLNLALMQRKNKMGLTDISTLIKTQKQINKLEYDKIDNIVNAILLYVKIIFNTSTSYKLKMPI